MTAQPAGKLKVTLYALAPLTTENAPLAKQLGSTCALAKEPLLMAKKIAGVEFLFAVQSP